MQLRCPAPPWHLGSAFKGSVGPGPASGGAWELGDLEVKRVWEVGVGVWEVNPLKLGKI